LRVWNADVASRGWDLDKEIAEKATNIFRDSSVFPMQTGILFDKLRDLCDLATLSYSSDMKMMDDAMYSDGAYIIAKDLLSMANSNTPSTNASYCLAGLVAVENCLQGGSLNSGTISQILLRLQASIEPLIPEIPTLVADSSSLIQLIWGVVGALARMGEDRRIVVSRSISCSFVV
jgi:hypothetical protein